MRVLVGAVERFVAARRRGLDSAAAEQLMVALRSAKAVLRESES